MIAKGLEIFKSSFGERPAGHACGCMQPKPSLPPTFQVLLWKACAAWCPPMPMSMTLPGLCWHAGALTVDNGRDMVEMICEGYVSPKCAPEAGKGSEKEDEDDEDYDFSECSECLQACMH